MMSIDGNDDVDDDMMKEKMRRRSRKKKKADKRNNDGTRSLSLCIQTRLTDTQGQFVSYQGHSLIFMQ